MRIAGTEIAYRFQHDVDPLLGSGRPEVNEAAVTRRRFGFVQRSTRRQRFRDHRLQAAAQASVPSRTEGPDAAPPTTPWWRAGRRTYRSYPGASTMPGASASPALIVRSQAVRNSFSKRSPTIAELITFKWLLRALVTRECCHSNPISPPPSRKSDGAKTGLRPCLRPNCLHMNL